MLKSALAKLAAAKILTSAAVAAAATGGVALAAANGQFPLSIGSDAPVTAAPSASGSAQAGAVPADGADSDATPSDSPSSTPSDASSSDATASPSATPSPSLLGLCNAYTAGVATSNGAALKNPAFTVLIQAAAGEQNVGDYCATLLATRPGNHSAPGDDNGQPASLPSTARTDHPSGPPSELPGNGRTDHPSGPPTDHPGKQRQLPEVPVGATASASVSVGVNP